MWNILKEKDVKKKYVKVFFCSKRKEENLKVRFCIMEWHQLKSPHSVSTSKTILVLLLARERQGAGKTRCTSQWLFLERKKKNPWWANLEREALFLCCPAAVLESCVCVTDNCHGSVSFHLFIIHTPPTSKHKGKAWKRSLFSSFFFHFHTLDSYLNHFVLLLRQFKNYEANTTSNRDS